MLGALVALAAVAAAQSIAPAPHATPPAHTARSPQAAPSAPTAPSQPSPQTTPQSAGAIAGRVVDAVDGTPVAGAQVTLLELGCATQSAADGGFAFETVPAGRHTLTVSLVGYAFARRAVDVGDGRVELTLPISPGVGAYQEAVTVSASASNGRRPPGVSAAVEATSATLQDLRGVAADDPMRAVQALPGVATGDDFQASFSVRGAPFRQIGVVVDGAVAARLLHAVHGVEDTGSVAMLNTDVLAGATLLAGAHPSRHGDWLGATIAFDAREGSRDRLSVSGAVSGTSASAVVEGPLGRGRRGSWLVSARRSYIDWLIRKLEPDVDSTIGFADGHAKVVFDLTPSQRAELLIVGGDATYREQQASLANGLFRATSGSTVAAATWRLTRARWTLTERVIFSGGDFDNRGIVGQQLARGYTQGLTWQTEIGVPLAGGWSLELGGEHRTEEMNQILREFSTAGPGIIRERAVRDRSAHLRATSGWGHVTRASAAGSVGVGLRATTHSLAAHGAISPWVLGERRIGRTTLRASAGASAQFADPAMFDPVTARVPPEQARSADAGVTHDWPRGLETAVTAFYRTESDVRRRIGEAQVDPATGDRVPASRFPIFATRLDGASHGVDVVVTRRAASGPTGWIGYTWAHTRYRDVVTGEVFDGDVDQRHTLNVFVQQRVSYRFAFSAKLRVGSNVPIVGYYETAGDGALHLASERNRVRLPVYARLDLRATRTFHVGERRLTLFAEVMNVTGRRNVRQSEASVRPNGDVVSFAERLVPMVPSVGIRIEF